MTSPWGVLGRSGDRLGILSGRMRRGRSRDLQTYRPTMSSCPASRLKAQTLETCKPRNNEQTLRRLPDALRRILRQCRTRSLACPAVSASHQDAMLHPTRCRKLWLVYLTVIGVVLVGLLSCYLRKE